jgi:hypothetical protein
MAKKVKPLSAEAKEVLGSFDSIVKRSLEKKSGAVKYTQKVFKDLIGRDIPKSALKNEKTLNSFLKKYQSELTNRYPEMPKQWYREPDPIRAVTNATLASTSHLEAAIRQLEDCISNLQKCLKDK